MRVLGGVGQAADDHHAMLLPFALAWRVQIKLWLGHGRCRYRTNLADLGEKDGLQSFVSVQAEGQKLHTSVHQAKRLFDVSVLLRGSMQPNRRVCHH